MKLNIARLQQSGERDRFSKQCDDILLTILSKVDIVTAVRAGVLAKRWRHLPWMLPQLNLDVEDFLRAPCPDPIEAQHVGQAMTSLTNATKCLLSYPHSKCTVTKLSLKLYITDNHWCDIGTFLNNAIENRVVTKLDLAIIDEEEATFNKDRRMRRRAKGMNGLFGACPNMAHCLTKLCLNNVRFDERDMHHLLFDCFQQLQHLFLNNCDNGRRSVWQINAPNSNLMVLEVHSSDLERLDVLCLPKLKRFDCDIWFNEYCPLRFGSVPSLEELRIACPALINQQELSLSEVLGGTKIHTLELDFDGEKVWLQPEIEQLWAAFSRLTKLSLLGIYVGFDLLWTIVVLEAAPSIEIFDIEIFDHLCLLDGKRIPIWGEQPPEPSWKVPEFTGSNKWQLKEVWLVNFRPLEQQMSFVRAMMERASNLKTIHLIEDVTPSGDCEALDTQPAPVGGMFPRDKDEQKTMIKQLRNGISSRAEIIFGSNI